MQKLVRFIEFILYLHLDYTQAEIIMPQFDIDRTILIRKNQQ